MNHQIKDRKQSRDELYQQLIKAGALPKKNNTFLCPFHRDKNPSSWMKRSAIGHWYFVCATCAITHDVWSLEAYNRGISLGELFKEYEIEDTPPPKTYYYKTVDELVDSIDDLAAVESIDPYTDPDTDNIELLVIRYRVRGEGNKRFLQAHLTPKGYVKKKPSGPAPLFNRKRVRNSDTVIFVEGEKAVRELTRLGFCATTGAGGSNCAQNLAYEPLCGKKVLLWADNDEPGKRYIEQVREKLLKLDPLPEVYEIKVEEEQSEGDDVVDLCEKVIAEGGTDEDCKAYINDLIRDASEINKLEGLENLLQDMRDGAYTNLPISGCPMLTQESAFLLNKRIGFIYSAAGSGKSLFIGKTCDDLVLAGRKVARLELEDELEQHLLRTMAQQSLRSELCQPGWHRDNLDASKLLYEQFRPMLETIAPSVVAGEHETWDDEKVVKWIEFQLRLGKELVVVDPISVIMTNQIWLTTHRLLWKTKALLANYPNSRVVFISHLTPDGQISGGQASIRFSHAALKINKTDAPKEYRIITHTGEEATVETNMTIKIVKSRYGRGSGIEIAVKLNSSTLQFEELGIITKEIKKSRGVLDKFRDIQEDDL